MLVENPLKISAQPSSDSNPNSVEFTVNNATSGSDPIKSSVRLTKKDHEKRIARAITNVRIAAIYILPIIGLVILFYMVRFYYLYTPNEQKLNHLSMLIVFLKDNGIPAALGAVIFGIFRGR